MSPSDDDLRSELERLRAENEALKAKERCGTRLQVSEKGGVSLYGLRRFPITWHAPSSTPACGLRTSFPGSSPVDSPFSKLTTPEQIRPPSAGANVSAVRAACANAESP